MQHGERLLSRAPLSRSASVSSAGAGEQQQRGASSSGGPPDSQPPPVAHPQRAITDAVEARFEEHLFAACLRIVQHQKMVTLDPRRGLHRIWGLRSQLAQHFQSAISRPFPQLLRTQNMSYSYNGKIEKAIVAVSDIVTGATRELRVIKVCSTTRQIEWYAPRCCVANMHHASPCIPIPPRRRCTPPRVRLSRAACMRTYWTCAGGC